MGIEVHVSIPGKPHGQQRARSARRGGKTITYDTKANRAFRQRAVDRFVYWKEANGFNGRFVFDQDTPLAIQIDAVYALPKSRQRKTVEVGPEWKLTAPDLSNIVKGVEDAAQQILFPDDRQVVLLYTRKIFARQGDSPCTNVLIWEADVGGAKDVEEDLL